MLDLDCLIRSFRDCFVLLLLLCFKGVMFIGKLIFYFAKLRLFHTKISYCGLKRQSSSCSISFVRQE